MRTFVSWPGSLCSPQTLRSAVLGAVTDAGPFSAVGVMLVGEKVLSWWLRVPGQSLACVSVCPSLCPSLGGVPGRGGLGFWEPREGLFPELGLGAGLLSCSPDLPSALSTAAHLRPGAVQASDGFWQKGPLPNSHPEL